MSMKFLPILLAAATLTPTAALARYSYGQNGYTEQQCYRTVYREQYHPGTRNRAGYVRRWTERQTVPCWNAGAEGRVRTQPYPYPSPPAQPHVDDNSCLEGSILGGIAGGAAGAALSRDEGMIYGIPLGIVGSALIGCQIDGG